MLANPVEYTEIDGGNWRPWPYPSNVKPSNLELLTFKLAHHVGVPTFLFMPYASQYTMIHSIRFDNGREWDTINGWRDGGGPN